MQNADCQVRLGNRIAAIGDEKGTQNLVEDLQGEKHDNDAKPQAGIGKRDDAADRNRQIQTSQNLPRRAVRSKNLVQSGKHPLEAKPDCQAHVACDENIDDERQQDECHERKVRLCSFLVCVRSKRSSQITVC